VHRAVAAYHDKKGWRQLQKNGWRAISAGDASAQRHIELYSHWPA
jgi:hypothetical protein